MEPDEFPTYDDPSEVINDICSHPDPNARALQFIRASEKRREREGDALAERLQNQRDNDPKYWKRKYEGLLQRIGSEKKEKKTTRDIYIGMLIFSAGFALIIFLIDKLL